MPMSPEFREEVAECLRRSGYLLESRLVRSLSNARFFVEPNMALVDPRTGKSREVDLVAEFYEHDPDHPNVSVRTYFVIEAINNHLPMILMTPHPGSPISDFEGFLRYGTTPEAFAVLPAIDLYEDKQFFHTVRYSQYCALTRKKGGDPNRKKAGDELMASHPDDLYSTLLKLAEFVEYEVSEFESREWPTEDKYWRLWFWQPILVLGGDLLVATEEDDGTLSINESDSAALIFNFHSNARPRSVVVQVLREKALMPYLHDVIAVDRRLAAKVHELRLSHGATAT